jgi:glyoxylase-like metal-dependent hydrolase (beta-lactamase superfamily II)
MKEIIPGIHWIKMPIPLGDTAPAHVNIYLVRGTEGYLLIDSGWNTDDSLATLNQSLAEIGTDIKDISRILVTHVHPDHYGMAGRIRRLSGARLLMHDIERGFISPRYMDMEELLHQTDTLLTANGVPHEVMVRLRDATVGLGQYIDPAFPDASLHHGQVITTGLFTFTTLWTPGHSSGHICLYEPDRKILFSGDHILPTITPNISVNPQSIENPLGRYLQSLQEMRNLDVELTLPGHDVPFKGYRGRIDEILEHHEQRNLEILKALDNMSRTTYEIAREITWGDRSRWTDLPDFHKRMAVFETLAHLEMMAAEGRLDRFPRDSIMYYRKT